MIKPICIAALILINSIFIYAQNPTPTATATPPFPPPLETILNEAQKQSENYKNTFRDLLADETKTFEEFDKNGDSEKKIVVKSQFLVYQSGKDAKTTAELRNVVEVNGKVVADGQKRSEQFLAELEKAETLEKELKKLQSEGSRFDKTWDIYGLTLNEAVTLAQNLRSSFDYKLLGTENYQGNEVYVVSYQQTKNNPNTNFTGKESSGGNQQSLYFNLKVPGELKKNDKFLRGKLWIDAKTFQLRREEQELIVQTPEPLNLLTIAFEYQPSEYGILVPKNITLTAFTLKKEKGSDKYVAVRDATAGFDYSRFRKANVEVRLLDEDEN